MDSSKFVGDHGLSASLAKAARPDVADARSHRDGTIARLASDLLPLCDWIALLGVPWLGVRLAEPGAVLHGLVPYSGSDVMHGMLAGAIVAPFILYDRQFGRLAGRGQTRLVLRGHAIRFALFTAFALALDALSIAPDRTPRAWLLAYLVVGLLLTSLARIVVAGRLSQRQPGTVGPPSRAHPGLEPAGPAAHQALTYLGGVVAVRVMVARPISRWDAVIKKAADLVLGGLATLLLLPILALIAMAIKIDSPGPVLFRQRRHALDNREFDILKFRTMRWAAAPQGTMLQQTARNDARVTGVGRFLRASSLDELPQLFNVLMGQMSLVGPRPHAVHMRTEGRLGTEIVDSYSHRHRIKPGITGWSQVNGARGATHSAAQLTRRIDLDLYYIENWSPWLDLKILILTVREVVRPDNAY